MKKFLPVFGLFLLLGANSIGLQAQTSVDRPLIWGTSPFQDSLWSIDTTNWQIVHRIGPTLVGFTITGMNGLATDPTTGITYVIMKVSAVTGRVLGTIDLSTGICTQVGNLGDNFSSITFDESGQMYGATGNGATVPETLYKIDKATGVKTLMYTMGNGVDGEVICYNKDDDHIYHWSGNGTVVFEKFPVTNVTYTPTNIPITGTPGGETFGVLYNGPGKFIISNIASNLKRLSTSGTYDAATLSNNPDDLRGLVMLPYFILSNNVICQNESITIDGGGHQLLTHYYYHWGDGNVDSLTNVTGVMTTGTHSYAAPGTYTVHIESYNGFGGDTIYSQIIQVINSPVVALSGFSSVCSGDSITLTGSSGGTSQWYVNGVLIVGATSNTYSTDQPGVYNMIKTNLNGCADSAATGITVVISAYPVVSIGADTASCTSYTMDANIAGQSYLWSSGDTTQTALATASGAYSVAVTNAEGCTSYDTINVTINALPVVNLGSDTSACATFTLDAGNAGSTYLWNTASTAQTEMVTVSGPYNVVVTDANGCSSADTVIVTINPNPVVNLGQDAGGCTNVVLTSVLNGSHLWSDNSTGTSLMVTNSGTYWLTFTDSVGCSGTDTINITIYGNPTVTATASSTTVCADDADVVLTGSPAGGIFSGTSVSGNNFDPSVGAGTYPIQYAYTDTNGCSGVSGVTIVVNTCVGIQESVSAGFTLFPNPSTGLLNINLTQDNSTVEVFDVLGNKVSGQKYNTAGTIQIDLNNQAQGVYFVQVTNGANKNVQKVIIQK